MSLRFSEFLESQKQENTEESVTEDAQNTEEPASSESTEEAIAESETEEAQEEQDAPSTEVRVTFEDRMRAKGLALPDGLDPEDLYDNAIERIAAGTAAMQEAERLRGELEKLRSQGSVTQAAPNPIPPAAPQQVPPPAATPAEKEHFFRELTEPDPAYAGYVTRDEAGRAIPRQEYGQLAVEAAQAINAYEQAERVQAQRLLRNPSLLIKDNMSEIEQLAEEKAQAIFEARFKAWQDEQQKAEKEQAQQWRQREEQHALLEFHEQNKGVLFNLGTNGEPLRLPFDQDQFSQTPTGKYFMERLPQLEQELPNTNRLTLLNIALREAKLAVPPQERQTKEAPVETQAEKRQKFSQQKQAQPSVPHQNTPAASASEVMSGSPRLKFSEMVRRDPENQDTITSWGG